MSDIGTRASTPSPGEGDLYRRIADSSTDWEYLEDADGRILWVSPSCEPLTGHSPEEFLRDPSLLSAVIHPEDRALFAAHRREYQADGEFANADFRIVRPDGVVRWIGHRCRPMSLPGGASAGRRCSNRDITERKKTEAELLRLNRTLRTLSDSNHILLHARVETDLLNDVCRIIVEDCGFAMVWVGYADDDAGKTVRPVAQAGFDPGYLDALNVTWADTERGRGPTGTAIRTGQPAVCRNILTDPLFAPWREEALKRGYASSLVLPLTTNGRAFGALNIYSREPDGFSKHETELLSELAADLSHGITGIRLRQAHAAGEKNLRQSEERYRTLFESMDQGFAVCEMIYDEEGEPSDARILSVNPAFARLTGWPSERAVGRTARELFPGIEPVRIEGYGRVVRSGRSERFHNTVAALGKDVEVFAWRTGIDRFAALFTDVTERMQKEKQIEWLASFPGRNPNAIVEAESDGHVHYANAAAIALCPDLDDPHVSHPWLADLEGVARRLREGGASTFSREVTMGERVFEQTMYYVAEAGRIRVYGKDITEAKHAEENLRQSQEHYRLLFENMLDGVADCEMLFENGRPVDFRYLAVNKGFVTLTGLKNVVGKKVTEVFPGIRESHPKLIETYGRVASTGKPERLEVNFLPLGAWLSISVYSNERGNFTAVFDDVTERRQAEEMHRLQVAALQAATDAFVITGKDGTIQWVNRAFTRLTGYSATEAIGMNTRVLRSGQHVDAFYKAIWDTILAGRVWKGEIVNRRKDGSLYTEEMTITPITDAGGAITQFVAVKQDVTERKRAEARLREME